MKLLKKSLLFKAVALSTIIGFIESPILARTLNTDQSYTINDITGIQIVLSPLTPGENIDSDKIQSNLKQIALRMKVLYFDHLAGNNDGEIHFGSNTYCIERPIRPLPYVRFTGEGPTNTIIKNVYAVPGPEWFHNAGVLMMGFDGPGEGSDDTDAGGTSHITYRRIHPNGYPEAGQTQFRTYNQRDWNDVHIGDEIKLVSAANNVDNPYDPVKVTKIRPDYLFKAIVVDKIHSSETSGYWLILDRQIPYTFSKLSSTDLASRVVTYPPGSNYTLANGRVFRQWGILNKTPSDYPPITIGEPAWFIVKEWYKPDTDDYWTTSTGVGYNIYKDVGEYEKNVFHQTDAKFDPLRWVKGWSSYHNTFSNMTFWSVNGNTTRGGGGLGFDNANAIPSPITFANCKFKGKVGLYFNSCQDTNFKNCTVEFWDEAAEFSYNSLRCQFNGLTCHYDQTLRPSNSSIYKQYGNEETTSMAMFNLNERSSLFTVTKLKITGVENRYESGEFDSLKNMIIRVCGRDNTFDNTLLSGTDQFSVREMKHMLYVVAQNNMAEVPTNVNFLNMQFNMNNNPTNSCLFNIGIQTGSVTAPDHVTISNVKFLNGVNTSNGKAQIASGYSKDITLGPGLFMPVQLYVPTALGGTNTIHYTNSSFAGFTHQATPPSSPSIETDGVIGTGASSFTWEP